MEVRKLSQEVTERDSRTFFNIINTDLTPEQTERIVNPSATYPRQNSIMALHWHPEFIPMELILRRVRTMYPNSDLELIIPTQHNVVMTIDGYSGVEVDCYSQGFNRKVQLLVHFEEARLQNASVFLNMLEHTFRYRQSQLYEFIDTLLDTRFEDRVQQAAAATGADEELVAFVRLCVWKVKELVDANYASMPKEMIRNKLLKYFIDSLRDEYDERFINRAQIFLQAVKRIVKERFSLTHFYEAQQIIEEVRSIGGGILVPHPEQFWPILLADYDVDGYEVWNPQSREYTNFLINVVNRKNQKLSHGEKPLLICMGDDCHMGEKVKEPRLQDPEKARREIGLQPAWDDLAVRKSLILANIDRRKMIEEYKSRLS